MHDPPVPGDHEVVGQVPVRVHGLGPDAGRTAHDLGRADVGNVLACLDHEFAGAECGLEFPARQTTVTSAAEDTRFVSSKEAERAEVV